MTNISLLAADDICDDCVRHSGLCRRHEKAILPQLAEPFWYRHVHSGMYHELKDEKDHSPEGRRIGERKERKRNRAHSKHNRLDLIIFPLAV